MPRRYVDYPDAYADWNFISSLGSYISAFGVLIFIVGVILPSQEVKKLQIIPGAKAQRLLSGRCHHHHLSTSSMNCRKSNRLGETPYGKYSADLPIIDRPVPRAGEVSDLTTEMASAADYFELLKPRVMSLVVFTTLIGMIMAPSGAGAGCILSLLLQLYY